MHAFKQEANLNGGAPMKPVGLYIHFPFCAAKCPYCDFYSIVSDEAAKSLYSDAVVKAFIGMKNKYKLSFDTIYFGGGTPSAAGTENIRKIAECVMSENGCQDVSEFTVECNPSFVEPGFFEVLAKCGVNRVSIGLQSAIDGERAALGRSGSASDVLCAVAEAQKAGITNISLDLMLGIPGQTLKSLEKSVNFCGFSGATHISAYLLKIEKGTPFFEMRDKLLLPDEDECAEIYLSACEMLEEKGFHQYEISNFARQGAEGRHNLKYWNCDEYLGIGPSAHSFLNGSRFYFERCVSAFTDGAAPVPDGAGGDFSEYAMLRLRLSDGLRAKDVIDRFGFAVPKEIEKAAKRLCGLGLVESDSCKTRLTRRGFIVSNMVISELLADL